MDVEVPDFEVDQDLVDNVVDELEQLTGTRVTFDLDEEEDVAKLKRAAHRFLDSAILAAKTTKQRV